MDTMTAFALGEASRNNPLKVFDWTKAAEIIRERNPETASAGLIEDWGYTGGLIYTNGQPVPEDDTYVYLASTWATPTLVIDDDKIDCYVMEDDTEWGSGTYWPKEALDILNAD